MSKEIIPIERVVQSIRWIRGQKVLFDSDLATLYSVTTGNLNKAVSRNRD
jgi:ORF6N domain